LTDTELFYCVLRNTTGWQTLKKKDIPLTDYSL